MTTMLDDLILRLSRHSTNSGYAYLKHAAELVVRQGKFPQRRLMSELYPQVAEDMGKTVCQVSRGICRATEDIWDNGGADLLRELLQKPWMERPAPGEMIYYIAYVASGGEVELDGADSEKKLPSGSSFSRKNLV